MKCIAALLLTALSPLWFPVVAVVVFFRVLYGYIREDIDLWIWRRK